MRDHVVVAWPIAGSRRPTQRHVPLTTNRGSRPLLASSLNDLTQTHDHGDGQEDVNNAAHRIRGDETQEPKHQQYDRDGIVLSLIHISEPTRLGMISYAVFCLKKKKTK